MTETIEFKRIGQSKALVYVLWIALAEAVGALAGFVTRAGSEYFDTVMEHPPFTAPAWVFPIAWAVLYALMGIGAARVYLAPRNASRSRTLAVFVVQLVVNFFWPVIFFDLEAYAVALIWLAVLFTVSVLMAIAFRRIDDAAGYIQIPYLIWLGYAAYINAGVWLLTM